MKNKNNELEVIIRPGKLNKTVCFIHGTSFGAWCWEEHWAPYFNEKGYRTISYTQRGNKIEETQSDRNKLGLSEYLEDFYKVIQNETGELIVIAHSVGCAVLLKLLQEKKVKLNKTVFLSPINYDGMFLEYLRFIFLFIKNKGVERIYFGNMEKKLIKHYSSLLTPVSKKITRQLLKPVVKKKWSYFGEAIVIGSLTDMGVSKKASWKLGRRLNCNTIFFPEIAHAIMLDAKWKDPADLILKFMSE